MTDRDFRSLLREHEPLIRRVLRAYEADPATREELAQEIALAFWRALPNYRAEAGMRTFVARIAHNVAVSNVRRRSKAPCRELLTKEMRDDRPMQDLERRSAYERLLSSVRRLPLPYRQAVTLALEDFSTREVAQSLGISDGAAAVRLTRARQLLAEMMRENG